MPSATAITISPASRRRWHANAQHWVEVFRTYYGPVHKAFAALDEKGQAAFEADLIALLRQSDRGGGAGLVVPSGYLETVITR